MHKILLLLETLCPQVVLDFEHFVAAKDFFLDD